MECNNFGDWLNGQLRLDSAWSQSDPQGVRLYLSQVQATKLALADLGLSSGQMVLVFFEGGSEWDVLEKACLALELVVVSIDHSYSLDQVRDILTNMEISAVIVQGGRWQMQARTEHSWMGMFKVNGVPVLDIDALVGASGNFGHSQCENLRFSSTRPQALATVVFSSGTTGQAQAVAYTQEQYLMAVESILKHLNLDPGLVTLSWLPLSNLFQRVANMVGRETGAKIKYVTQPKDIMRAVAQHRPHMLIAVPLFFQRVYQRFFPSRPTVQSRMLQALLHLGWARKLLVRKMFGGRMKFFISGSAACSEDVLNFFDHLGLPIYEAYGLSENIIPIAANRPGARRKGSVGQILSENELKIASDGEIWVRGPGVGGGYFGSGTSFMNVQGYYPTGDLGRLSEDGFLFLTGRKANTFKNSAGKRICPEPLEQAIKEATLADFSLILGPNQPWLSCVVNYQSCNMPKADKIKKSIEGFMEGVLSGTPYHLRPRLFFITDFELKAGEILTPNMKLKRMSVVNRIAADLESLSGQVESVPMGIVERLPHGQGYYYRTW